MILPLASGVFVGAVLLTHQTDAVWWQSFSVFYDAIKDSIFSPSHLQALAFSLLLGSMVGVLEAGGGMQSLIAHLSKQIRSRIGGQCMIASAGLAVFFDDYANTLLVGGTMRSSADKYGISREKLAYLVDSTAAPIAGLSVVSTWAAIEISYMADGLRNAGITQSSAAFEMFLNSIMYRFYPWLALVMVFVVARTGRDFGPMATAETKSLEKLGTRMSTSDQPDEVTTPRWLWAAAVVPVLACLVAVAVVLIKTGVDAAPLRATGESGPLERISDVLGNGDSYLSLIVGGAVGLVSALVMHRAIDRTRYAVLAMATLRGALQMMPAMLILWFAWALSSMTEPDKLDTGGYLAAVLSERLDARLLPTIVFLIAGAMAFATGTSWGTMGILTPLSISLALRLDPVGGPEGAIALSTCGAVLAGAIFGDHCSPISDTTVLSSRASGCDHLAHVKTQFPYAILVGVVCVVLGTIPSALGVSPWLCLIAGAAVLIVIMRLIAKVPIANAQVAESSVADVSAGNKIAGNSLDEDC